MCAACARCAPGAHICHLTAGAPTRRSVRTRRNRPRARHGVRRSAATRPDDTEPRARTRAPNHHRRVLVAAPYRHGGARCGLDRVGDAAHSAGAVGWRIWRRRRLPVGRGPRVPGFQFARLPPATLLARRSRPPRSPPGRGTEKLESWKPGSPRAPRQDPRFPDSHFFFFFTTAGGRPGSHRVGR